MRASIQDLVNVVADRARLNKTESRIAIDAVFDTIKAFLIEGREIRISKFGSFVTKERDWLSTRDPRDGKKVLSPPRRWPFFKFSDFVEIPVNHKYSKMKVQPAEKIRKIEKIS